MHKQPGPFGNAKLIFPLSMHLKVIMENTCPIEKNRQVLEKALNALKIPHKEWTDKTSGEKKYVSFTVKVDLQSRELMFTMYEELKKVPGLRMAL